MLVGFRFVCNTEETWRPRAVTLSKEIAMGRVVTEPTRHAKTHSVRTCQ